MDPRFGMCLRPLISAVCFLLVAQGSVAFAQLDQTEPVQLLSSNQLDSLVAPIALYPDTLMSQILVAATYPLEVVEARQWLQRNPGLAGPALTDAAAIQNWDPSVQALVMFPDVLKRLSEDVTWTIGLGNAFLDQEQDVMRAIQRMRLSAQQTGQLGTTPQQQVITVVDSGQPVVEIVPASSEVIYVPVYDPVSIWGPVSYYPYPRWYSAPQPGTIFFGAPVPVSTYFGRSWNGWSSWGWRPNWGVRTIVINNTFIRRHNFNSTRLANFPETTVWSHDALHRRGVPYSRAARNRRYEAGVRQDVRQRPSTTATPAPSQWGTFVPPSGNSQPIARPRPEQQRSPGQVSPDAPTNRRAFRRTEGNEATRPRRERNDASPAPAAAVPAPPPAAPDPTNVAPQENPAPRPSREAAVSRSSSSRMQKREK